VSDVMCFERLGRCCDWLLLPLAAPPLSHPANMVFSGT
jgi:hypothetical protein